MKNTDSVELRLSPTSITVKRGTKRLLDSLGSKRESYDEIIRRLVRENKQLRSQLPEPVVANRLKISSYKRKSLSQSFGDRKLFFEFTVPGKDLLDFRFDIHYTKVIGGESAALDRYAAPLEMAKDYLSIIERLLKAYIDPLFRVDQRRLLDLDWWRQRLRGLGFSEETYRVDIEEKLIHMGVLP